MWEFVCPVCGKLVKENYDINYIKTNCVGMTHDCLECGAILMIEKDGTCSDFGAELVRRYSEMGLNGSKEQATDTYVSVADVVNTYAIYDINDTMQNKSGQMTMPLEKLQRLIEAAHTAGWMEAKGTIQIDNEDELTEFLLSLHNEWENNVDKDFREFYAYKLLNHYHHV